MRRNLKGHGRGRGKLFALGLICIILGIFLLIYSLFANYNTGKIIISAPFSLGSYEFSRSELSEKELDIAWRLYVQLTTRKAAIPIDEDDIIIEVYNSWYELFKSTRDYLLGMAAADLEENENAQRIVDLSVNVLNNGLRPHLTKWQGKYRKWYEDALKEKANKGLSPQEIQKKYPEYEELRADIKIVNLELVKYAEELKKFSHEKPPGFSARISTKIVKVWEKLK